MVVKSVGVLSVGKILGCLYTFIGLIIGGLFSLISMAGAAIGGAQGGRGNAGAGPAALFMGIGAVVIFPVIYGVIGLIGGIIMAALYNVVAAVVGGIEIELRQTEEYRED